MPRDRLQRQRFEQKYILTEDQAEAAREFVSAHLELDENGIGKPHYSYPVHSLYLDSGLLDTFWATINGDKNRYKLRLRFYDDYPDTPVFFELKFTDRFPGWFQRLIERFDLMQCGAAKYCEGLGGLAEFNVSHAADFRGAGEEDIEIHSSRRIEMD